MKHIFIVNPAAGKSDRTAEYREMIDAAFAPRGLSYELLVSGAPGECRTLARQAAQSGEEVRLYACGGDGTLNEVINGVVGYDNAAVTHFPGGSGNDAIKIFDDPAAFTSIERLLDAEEARFDLIRCNGSYALNVLSIGFDARVGTDIARFKRLPLVSGKGAYILSIFSNMLHGLTADYTVTLDSGEVFSGRKTMICVCKAGGTAAASILLRTRSRTMGFWMCWWSKRSICCRSLRSLAIIKRAAIRIIRRSSGAARADRSALNARRSPSSTSTARPSIRPTQRSRSCRRPSAFSTRRG